MFEPFGKTKNVFQRDPKTNETLCGIYSLPEVQYLSSLSWRFTEKLDGTSTRIICRAGQPPEIRARTNRAQIHPEVGRDLVEQLCDSLLPDSVSLKEHGADFCIYGETVGPKIQSGGKYTPDGKHRFYAFDIRGDDGIWYTDEAVREYCAAVGIPVVPEIFVGALHRGILKVNRGLVSSFGIFRAEGLIARPNCPMMTYSGERISVKIKDRDLGPEAEVGYLAAKEA